MASNPSASEFSNSILICVDCTEEFVFTASAQQYFAERGFTEPPKRCKACYNDYRKGGPGDDGADGPPDLPIPPPAGENGGGQPPGDRP